MGHTRPLFTYFHPFLNALTNIVQKFTINLKNLDGVLEIQTQDHRMVGGDKSTELWRPHRLRSLNVQNEEREIG